MRAPVVLKSSPLVALLSLLLLFLLQGGGSGPQESGSGSFSGLPPLAGPPPMQQVAGAEVLRGRTIVVDPGHGGVNRGARGLFGVQEKDVVLRIGLALRSLLEREGARVIMTREGDYLPGGSWERQLAARVELANRVGANLLVSIHADSNKPWYQGTTTYYLGNSSGGRRLAESVQRAVTAALGSQNRGIRAKSFYVLRHSRMPAVLVEVGFLSNPLEERRLADPGYQERAARGILQGIVNYLQ
ncbi:MAG: N-acetylmuramoyl-L-alanine amidase [Bacillota bacterium]|nr:N-acetylmuramoyl-L-alanine amidase [Bacillota bacterium]